MILEHILDAVDELQALSGHTELCEYLVFCSYKFAWTHHEEFLYLPEHVKINPDSSYLDDGGFRVFNKTLWHEQMETMKPTLEFNLEPSEESYRPSLYLVDKLNDSF